jgi:hypothetical protein
MKRFTTRWKSSASIPLSKISAACIDICIPGSKVRAPMNTSFENQFTCKPRAHRDAQPCRIDGTALARLPVQTD